MGEFLALGLLDRCGYTEVMDVLRRVLRFRNDRSEWEFRAQTDKEKEALRRLGLMPQLPRRESLADLIRTLSHER